MQPDDETEERREQRLALQRFTAELAYAIRRCLPEGTGFVVLTFDFGTEGSFAYASNGNRDDVLRFLAEAREKIRADG